MNQSAGPISMTNTMKNDLSSIASRIEKRTFAPDDVLYKIKRIKSTADISQHQQQEVEVIKTKKFNSIQEMKVLVVDGNLSLLLLLL